jgi:O-antigen/teichoic acid export membrane protein
LIVLRLGTEAAWYFSNRSSLMQIYTIVLGPVLGLVFPITSQLLAEWDQQKYQLYQKILFKGVFLVSIPLGVMFVSFWPSVAQILFGDAFVLSWQLAQISGRFIRANVIVSVCFGFLAGNGMVMQRVKLLSVVVCLNVLMNFLFVKVLWLWLTGFILSVSLTWIILSVLSLYLLRFLSTFIQEKMFFLLNALILVIGAWWWYYVWNFFMTYTILQKILIASGYLLFITSIMVICNRSLVRAFVSELTLWLKPLK